MKPLRTLILLGLCVAVPPSAWAADGKPHPKKPAPTKATAGPAQDAPRDANTVVLQGLNKVTGHISKIEGPLGATLNFGNIEIVARRCWKSPPDERPENAALLDISELRAGEPPHAIFTGWMFSSSPGLSGLEHPVYDVNVLACEYRKDPEPKDEKEKPR